jgi:pimeloyl-ACP methyl ester carboxylesterase
MVVLILIGALAGVVYQAIASSRDRGRYGPPGTLVDVGAYRLHIHCVGSGDPTVILEAGAGGNWLDWSLVQESIAEFTRVCSYDRAGFGWSEGNNQPLAAQRVAADLNTLLTNASVDPPYALVGHSVGGIYVRSFARQYPQGVAGMVLVESSHESQGSRMPAELTSVDPALLRLLSICRAVAPFGLMRLLNVAESFTTGLPFSDEHKRAYVATMNRTGYCSSVANEYEAADRSTKQQDPPGPLGDMPLFVISAGPQLLTDSSTTDADEVQTRADSIWRILQTDLAELSTNSTHIFADESGHYVQYDQPEVVIAAIRQVVDAVRQPSGSH